MPRLHELLAVEGQLKGQAQATRGQLAETFTKRRHHFEEKIVAFVPSEEGKLPETEQQSDLQTTVAKELAWIAGLWSKALDVSYSVAEANMSARADVVLEDGTKLLENVPATALMELEKRAGEIQELVLSIPTLDPTKGFTADTDRGKGVYRAREVRKDRTKKTAKVVVLIQPTPEHPGQAQLVPEDVVTGKLVENEWSSMITPSQKAEMLERAESLRRAIKQARQRANEVQLTTLPTCGAKIFGFVFGA